MMRALLLALSTRPTVGRATTPLAPTRRLVRRFVAGRRREDAPEVVSRLNTAALDAALTDLGAHVRRPEDHRRFLLRHLAR